MKDPIMIQSPCGAYVITRDGQELAEFRPDGTGWWDARMASGKPRRLWATHTLETETDVALTVATRLLYS
ncbi:hypothetical protein GCM10010191_89000 [Actinomadura vinacea]|uniref:Uncharacterized protein n=1 Tax=Actinomadura vinacea TaxID=115336 RepID=A0ABN3KCH8_9ACTN